MGIGWVLIGGAFGSLFAATLTQWYYQQRLGENGIGCLKDTSCHFDLGWGDEGLSEIRQDLFDLQSQARQLEEELRTLRRAQFQQGRDGVLRGMEGVKKMGKKVLGVGGKVQAILPLPRYQFFSILGLSGRGRRPADEEAQEAQESTEMLDDDEVGDEINRRRREIEAELQHVREQEQILQRMDVGTSNNSNST